MSTRPEGGDGPPSITDETRAHDLLPTDQGEWVPPVRKIAERRTAGWFLAERLLDRRGFRPAGNSRRFWSRVEDDDPFLPRPDGRRMSKGGGSGPYPADRLVRMEGGRAQPAGGVKAYTAPPRAPAPAPKPAPPQQPTPAPAPARRPAPAPQAAPQAPPVDRRPPRLPNPGRKSPSGRMSVGRESARGGAINFESAPAAAVPTRQLVNAEGRTAAEVRAEKTKEREAIGPAKPPPLRNLDEILGIMGDLSVSESVYRQHRTRIDAGASTHDLPPVPVPDVPKKYVPPPKARQPAPPPQAPPPRAPDPERRATAPIDRSSSGRSNSGGLDDLFGGAQEGRVRLGRRAKPSLDDGE